MNFEKSNEGREQIKKEEYARVKGLKVVKKLDEGDIEKAREIFIGNDNFFGKNYDKETQILIENIVIPFVKEKIINDISNKKGDEVVKIIDGFDSYLRNGDMKDLVEFIKPEDLKQIPEKILKAPEIVEKIKSFLIDNCKKNLHPNHYGIFKSTVEKFSKLGFISEEEIIKSPEVKNL